MWLEKNVRSDGKEEEKENVKFRLREWFPATGGQPAVTPRLAAWGLAASRAAAVSFPESKNVFLGSAVS